MTFGLIIERRISAKINASLKVLNGPHFSMKGNFFFVFPHCKGYQYTESTKEWTYIRAKLNIANKIIFQTHSCLPNLENMLPFFSAEKILICQAPVFFFWFRLLQYKFEKQLAHAKHPSTLSFHYFSRNPLGDSC